MIRLLVVALVACAVAPTPAPLPRSVVEPATTAVPSPTASPTTPPPDAAPQGAPVTIPGARPTIVVTSSDPCGFVMDLVYFDEGSPVPSPGQAQTLDQIATMMICLLRTGEAIQWEVRGNTDVNERDPQRLSDARAANVAHELVKRGVERLTLTPRGYGATLPMDRASGDAARAKNRRVEVMVLVLSRTNAPAP